MPHVVLAGAGHGHLHTLQRVDEYLRRRVDLTLLAPGPFSYSGMASGVLGGAYEPGANVVDPGTWVTRAGGTVVRDAIVHIDAAARRVHLAGGGELGYDVLSLNLGSETALPAALRDSTRLLTVKPVERLTELRLQLERRMAEGAATRVIVAGGGASGCEAAANLVALATRGPGSITVTLIHDGSRLLPEATPAASAALTRHLRARGIAIRTGSSITGWDGRHATIAASAKDDATTQRAPQPRSRDIAADLLVAATGLRPPPVIATSRLPMTGDGGLRVDSHLRSIGDPRVFGVGDCASLEGYDLASIGVHAIRQAPVLHHNLIATATAPANGGARLRAFDPQRHYLLVLNLGGGHALATRGSLHWKGRAAWWLKRAIDHRFMEGLRAG
jgi:NADH dehydrogenase FAD-containing subunit